MGLRKQPDNNPNQPEWVSIYITHNLQEAHIIAGKLQTYDIPSMVHTEPGASAIGITIGSLGEIKVLIHPKDYDRASDILFGDDVDQLEDSTDKVQYIWHDDGDGAEYFIEDDDDDDDQ